MDRQKSLSDQEQDRIKMALIVGDRQKDKKGVVEDHIEDIKSIVVAIHGNKTLKKLYLDGNCASADIHSM